MSKNNNKNTPVTEEIELAPAPATTALTTNAGQFDDEFAADVDVLTKDDVVIGRLKICQAMTRGKKEQGWQEGDLYDTATKQSFKSMLIVPVAEERVVVERMGEGKDQPKGTFVREHAVDSEVVQSALKRNGEKFGKELSTLDGNSLEETRNIHVARLADDGVTVEGFHILVATSTNLYPVKLWKTNRVQFTREPVDKVLKSAATLPQYSFRTMVDGQGVHSKNETCLYRFSPFRNNNWKDSAIDPNTCSEQELALLRSLKKHAELVKSGAVKVAEYGDADTSEEAAEDAAF